MYKRYVYEPEIIILGLETWLKEKSWLAGDKMTIADISFLSWYEEAFVVDVDLEKEVPVVNKWLETM